MKIFEKVVVLGVVVQNVGPTRLLNSNLGNLSTDLLLLVVDNVDQVGFSTQKALCIGEGRPPRADPDFLAKNQRAGILPCTNVVDIDGGDGNNNANGWGKVSVNGAKFR
jgi:hypothetical protein